MRVHIFGNTSSPSVAEFSLRYSAKCSAIPAVINMVNGSFYVDDSLSCYDTPQEATETLRLTIKALKKHNIRLHKIASNSKEVLNQFANSELAEPVSHDIPISSTQEQTVLGLKWDITSDNFIACFNKKGTVETKRQLLSLINSVYDPLGFVTPTLLKGKQLLRQSTSKKYISSLSCVTQTNLPDWNDKLPDAILTELQSWYTKLEELNNVTLPRLFINENATTWSLHCFSDASEIAVRNAFFSLVQNLQMVPLPLFLFKENLEYIPYTPVLSHAWNFARQLLL